MNPAGPLIEEFELVIRGIDGREASIDLVIVLQRRFVVPPRGIGLRRWRGAALVCGIEILRLSSRRFCDQNTP